MAGGKRGWRAARRAGGSPAGAGRSPPGGRRGPRGTLGWTHLQACLQRRRGANLAALLHVSAFHSGSDD